MKNIIILTACFFMISVSIQAQVLKSIKVYYHDTVTNRGKDIYRELKQVTDDGIWAKPEKIDIVLLLNKKNGAIAEQLEILIEQLYEPTSLLKNEKYALKEKTWVPFKVVYDGNMYIVKTGKVVLKDVDFQTAYFLDSILYSKIGFRIVGVYYNTETKKLEKKRVSILYDE